MKQTEYYVKDGSGGYEPIHFVTDANIVNLSDEGNLFSSINTEGALQEIGYKLAATANDAIRNKQLATHPNLYDSYGLLLDDFSSDWTAVSPSIIATETTIKKFGNQSIRLLRNSVAGASAQKNININFNGEAPTVGVWVYLNDVYDLSGIRVWFTSDEVFSKSFEATTRINYKKLTGWNYLIIDSSDWENYEDDSWSNTMIKCQVRVEPEAGHNPSAVLGGIFVNVKQASPKILVEFDDCWQSAYYNGVSYMMQKGLRGTLNFSSNYAGNTSPLTIQQYKCAYDNGWTIGNHTNNHPDLRNLTKKQQLEEFDYCRQIIVQNKLGDGLHVAYPSSFYNDDTLAVLRENGYKTGRTVGQVRNSPMAVNEWYYRLDCESFGNNLGLQDGKDYVDDIIAKKCIGIFLFHELNSTSSGNAWAITDFKTLVDYIIASGVEVITREELYDFIDITY